MRVLVSGGSGFIGYNFLSHLIKKNQDIMVIVRDVNSISKFNVKKVILDLNEINNNFQKIIDFNPDVFVHLAWEGIPDYSYKFSKRNYLNTIKFIRLLVNSTNCSKIISSGSCWEYNDGNIDGLCHEGLNLNPLKPFSVYKSKIYKDVSLIADKKNITFNWLRMFYVYGVGQRIESIIPSLINNIKNKKKINLNYPANINDYIYIDDLVKIMNIFVLNNFRSGIYNLGSGKGIEVRNLLKIIDLEINGNDFLTQNYLKNIDKHKRNQNFYACTKKLLKNISDFQFTDINTGVQKIIKGI